MTDPPKPAASAPKDAEGPNRVLIRPMPRAVILYPTAIVALVFGLICLAYSAGTEPEWIGLAFVFIFAANLFVMNFEFGRAIALALFAVVLALVFFVMFLSERWNVPIFGYVGSFFRSLHIHANAAFYLCVSAVLGITFLCVVVNSRFDYWEITSNELLHHHGMWGNIERYPSPNLRISKEIPDLFEFLLMGSGTLVLFPASESRTITLEMVFRVNQKEEKIKRLLGRLQVSLESDRRRPDA
ncbi:MAG: hypothetical protein L0216_21265 [Planctomycetales bacterium]|nr:hypothetical protein [Planctomycetales bacterium]